MSLELLYGQARGGCRMEEGRNQPPHQITPLLKLQQIVRLMGSDILVSFIDPIHWDRWWKLLSRSSWGGFTLEGLLEDWKRGFLCFVRRSCFGQTLR